MAVARTRSKFFVIVALTMIVLIFWAFAPTFYLRPFFERMDPITGPNLPDHLVLHGFALSTWFSLFFAQTLLAVTHRINLHRVLGVAGIVVALAVIGISGYTSFSVIRRMQMAGVDVANASGVVMGNILNLTGFASFVACAVYFRRRPDLHKRFMFLACVMLLPPALSTSRPIGMLLQSIIPMFGQTWYANGWWLAILGAIGLVSFDIVERRRVTAVTGWAGIVIVTAILLVQGLNASGASTAFVRWLA